ncbi:MAG TPA: carboxypeptidase regulatory-like domain-containing protein [Vicinamibacterales bacterium]|nr:carboxypeptidase regulatory-like domain-containing protein [Vicinamibacterales bacterium]
MRLPTAALALLLATLAASPAFAQRQTASVQGVVVDEQGRAVSGATVRLVDSLGGILRTVITGDAGRFLLADIPSGRFIVQADTSRGTPVRVPVTVESALPVEVTVRLLPLLAEKIQVTATARDTPSSFSSLASGTLAAVPVRIRGRSLQDAIATLPGWATEDNGLLHTRGVDDGFLYVIDGVPVYERLDALNGFAPDVTAIGSINVVTGYVPPEFGYKAGGVIEVRSAEARERWHAAGDFGLGHYRTADAGLIGGGSLPDRLDFRVGGSGQRSDRFLDPMHPDNLHNQGASGTVFGHVGYRTPAQDRVRASWSVSRTRTTSATRSAVPTSVRR